MFNVIIAGLTSLFTDISTEMVYPLLPLFLTAKLGATPAIVGIIEGIAESVASILKVFSGALSDRLGRRKPLAIGGYALSVLGKVFLFLAGSWPVVLVGRVVDRLGKGIRTAPRDALIAESSEEGKRGAAFGLHRFMDTFGASTGIILAYYFLTAYKGDYKTVFLYSIVPAILGVAFLFFIRENSRVAPARTPEISNDVSESLADASSGSSADSWQDRCRTPSPTRTGNFSAARSGRRVNLLDWSKLDPRLKAFLLVVFLFTLGNSSNQFLLLRAGNLGFEPAKVILLYLTYNLVYTLVSYPAGKLSDRIGRRVLLVLGYLAYGIVYLGFALASKASTLWYLFAAYGIYIGFTEGVEKALVADIAPPDQRATVIGLHATLVGIGLLPASALAGFLWNTLGPRAPFFFGGATGVAAALGLSWVLRETRA